MHINYGPALSFLVLHHREITTGVHLGTSRKMQLGYHRPTLDDGWVKQGDSKSHSSSSAGSPETSAVGWWLYWNATWHTQPVAGPFMSALLGKVWTPRSGDIDGERKSPMAVNRILTRHDVSLCLSWGHMVAVSSVFLWTLGITRFSVLRC